MRQIKFRAWNKHTNKMINSVAILGIWEKFVTGFDRDYIHNSQDWGSQDDFAYDFELMQFTGLQDKNGKDIYENDWVIIETISDIPRKVLFIDGGFRYITSKHFFTYPMSDYRIDEIEVIGNIHENPELLNQ